MRRKTNKGGPNQCLREAREAYHWSQKEVAERIGTTTNNVSRWELGQTMPGPYFRAKLCALLGKSAQELGFAEQAPQISTTSEEVPEEGALTNASPRGNHLLCMIPYPRNPFFLGRDQEIAHVRRCLQAGRAAALAQPHALSGLGGIGKTQIAVEYAYRYIQDYQTILWAYAQSSEALSSSYVSFAAFLELPEREAREQETIIEAVKRWLQLHHDWLLILDNADELAILPGFLPPQPGGHLLLTTRAQASGRLARRLNIESLSPELGMVLLLRRSGLLAPDASLEQVSPEEQALAIQITQELGGLPLALDQAGAYLEETSTSLAQYWQLYQQYRADLLRERRGGFVADHPLSVTATWSVSFQRIQERNPGAAELLRLLAWLPADAIAEEILPAGTALLGPVLGPIVGSPLLLNEALEALRAYSLVHRDPKTHLLALHRLVQAVLQDQQEQEERQMWAERAVRLVNAAFPVADEEMWPTCERLLPLALTAAKHIEQQQMTFQEAGRLLFEAASYLRKRANYGVAERLYQQAIYIFEQQLELEHPQLADVLSGLANLYWEQSRYGEAEPLIRRALHIREQQWGPQHPQVAHSLSNLALIYLDQGKYVEAEPLYRRALHLWEQQLGPEHSQVGVALNGLANISLEHGKYEEAEQLYQRALHLWEQQLGPEHPWLVYALIGLANLYLDQGKYVEAGRFYQRALRIREQQLGPEHPQVAYALLGLAKVSREQGKYAEAEQLYQRALHLWEQQSGQGYAEAHYALIGLANLYWEQGRYAEAEPLLQRALHMRVQQWGPEHRNVAFALSNIAELYSLQGKYTEAEPLFQRALHILEPQVQEQQAGPELSAYALLGLANLYRKQGKYAEAEALYQQVLHIREQRRGYQHPETAETLHDFATLHVSQGHLEEAVVFYQRALAIREHALGGHHPKTTETRKRLGAILALTSKM